MFLVNFFLRLNCNLFLFCFAFFLHPSKSVLQYEQLFPEDCNWIYVHTRHNGHSVVRRSSAIHPAVYPCIHTFIYPSIHPSMLASIGSGTVTSSFRFPFGFTFLTRFASTSEFYLNPIALGWSTSAHSKLICNAIQYQRLKTIWTAMDLCNNGQINSYIMISVGGRYLYSLKWI